MMKYKVHKNSAGDVVGFGPNVEEYQPQLEDGDSLDYADVPPPPTTLALFASLRVQRDARLAHTDKILLADYPITAEALEKVKAYRTSLRDLPDQPGAPWDGGGELTPWPEKPNF